MLLQTYIEYLRGLVEEKKTINHHGREREIDLETTTEKLVQVKPAANQAFDLEWVSLSDKRKFIHERQLSGKLTIWGAQELTKTFVAGNPKIYQIPQP